MAIVERSVLRIDRPEVQQKNGSVAAKSPRIAAGISGLTRCCGVIPSLAPRIR